MPPPAPLDVARVRALHDEGVLARDIAAQLGSSYAVVASALRQQGVEPHLAKRGPKGLSPEQVAEAVRLHDEGLHVKDVAAQLGASPHATGRALQAADRTPLTGRRRTGPSERDLAMVAAYHAGRTLEDIGREHGLTRERVRQVLLKQGVTRSNRVLSGRDRREAAFDEQHGEAVRTSLAQSHSVRLTAEALGLSQQEVRSYARRHDVPLEQTLVERRRPAARWTKEACTAALRAAWQELGEPASLPSAAYRRWLADGGSGPSYPTLAFEFGSFNDAVAAAGLTGVARRVRSDRLDDDEILDSLRRFVADGGYEGSTTNQAYVAWAKENGGVSLALLRRRGLQGRSWAEGLREAGLGG